MAGLVATIPRCLYLTRLPASRYFYLISDVQRLFPPEELQRELLVALANPRVRVVIVDGDCAGLPGEVQRYIARRFVPLPELPWVRLRR